MLPLSAISYSGRAITALFDDWSTAIGGDMRCRMIKLHFKDGRESSASVRRWTEQQALMLMITPRCSGMVRRCAIFQAT